MVGDFPFPEKLSRKLPIGANWEKEAARGGGGILLIHKRTVGGDI